MRNATSFSDFSKILIMRLKRCDLKLPTIPFGFVACTFTTFSKQLYTCMDGVSC